MNYGQLFITGHLGLLFSHVSAIVLL